MKMKEITAGLILLLNLKNRVVTPLHVADDYHERLRAAGDRVISELEKGEAGSGHYSVYNGLSWVRDEVVEINGEKIQVSLPAIHSLRSIVAEMNRVIFPQIQ